MNNDDICCFLVRLAIRAEQIKARRRRIDRLMKQVVRLARQIAKELK